MKQVELLEYIKACHGENPNLKPLCLKASSRDRESPSDYITRNIDNPDLVSYITNQGYDYKFPDGVVIVHNVGEDNTPMFKKWSWSDYTVAHCPEGIVFDKKFIDLKA